MRLRQETQGVGRNEKKLHLPEAIRVPSRGWPLFALVVCNSPWGKKKTVFHPGVGQQLKWRKTGEVQQHRGFQWTCIPLCPISHTHLRHWPHLAHPFKSAFLSSGGSWQSLSPQQPIRSNIRQCCLLIVLSQHLHSCKTCPRCGDAQTQKMRFLLLSGLCY